MYSSDSVQLLLVAFAVSFLMSHLKSIMELLVYMDVDLGSPKDRDEMVNSKFPPVTPAFLNFFEGGWGEVSCFHFFFTSDLGEVGGSIGCGFLPGYFLFGAGDSQTLDVEG